MRFFLFLLLTYSNLSLALGIGDITLLSHLGEPLVATIVITDVEKSPDANCFSVTDFSEFPALKKAFVTLNPSSNNSYLLNIGTHNVISEPIVNLRVSFHCDPELNREYILLLDPAPLINTETTGSPAVASKPTITNEDKNKSQTPVNTESNAHAVQEKHPKKKPARQTIAAESTVDAKLTEAYTGKRTLKPAANSAEERALTKQTETQISSSKPYLIISGGNTSTHGSLPNLALRMESQIDFARSEPTTPLSATDAMDEVTVMANRLAHLEKEIISLQNRNSQLLHETEKTKNTSLELSEQQSQWLKNILIIIGTLAALVVIEFSRRKLLRNRLNKAQDDWFKTEEHSSGTFSASESDGIKNTISDDPFFDQSTYSPSFGANAPSAIATSFSDETENEHETILENAEVFIAHGRPALAIQLLQNYLGDFPSESPKTWLKLLSLLASDGSETEYNSAVTECKLFFNIKMPAFAEANAPDHSSLEDFPHIVTKLQGVWGSQAAIEFLNDLIYNQQSQPREGFERGTFEDLFFLRQIAEILSVNLPKELSQSRPPVATKPLSDVQLPLINAEPSTQPVSFEHKVSDSLTNADFQNAEIQTEPLAEVTTSFDFDTALLNAQLKASPSATPMEIESSELAEEIDFSLHTSYLEADDNNTKAKTDNTNEPTKKAKKSNVIEWD